MYHSVYIGSKNTWDDYALVPAQKIYISTPSQKTKTVELEGASGSLDFSTLLTGYPIYGNRQGSMAFYLLDRADFKALTNNGYPYPANFTFYDIFDRLVGELDGKTFRVWLEDDPDWYYEGRINVTTAMGSPRPGVSITYNFQPYKKSRRANVWTMPGLGTSVINRQIISSELAGSMPGNFSFSVTGAEAEITFKCPALQINETKTFQTGSYEVFEWVVYGESTIEVSASTSSTVTVTYVNGRL